MSVGTEVGEKLKNLNHPFKPSVLKLEKFNMKKLSTLKNILYIFGF